LLGLDRRAHPAGLPRRPGGPCARALTGRPPPRESDHPSRAGKGAHAQIGVPTETAPGETRVAATPETVPRLRVLGHDGVVQAGAGERAGCRDEDYAEAGATVGSGPAAWQADLVVRIEAPDTQEVPLLRPGAMLASQLSPAQRPHLLEALAEQKVTALALDAVPRISRAQSLDVLSSMTNLGGYRAVVEAAYEYGSVFTGQV